MTTAAVTPESVINAEIASLKAAAITEITELQAQIAKDDINWLDTSVVALQSEVAFLSALKEIEFSFASVDESRASGKIDDDQSALIRKLFILVQFQGNTAQNSSTTKDIIRGRVNAANAIARTVADVSRDLARGTAL